MTEEQKRKQKIECGLFPLSNRTYFALRRAGIKKREDLQRAVEEKTIFRVRGIGKTSMAEIQHLLSIAEYNKEIRQSKIYISGEITGTTDYMERFEKIEKKLGKEKTINPAKVNAQLPECTTYNEYLKMSLCMLEMCDCIFMMKGWEFSKGARLEYEYAYAHGYEIIFEDNIPK